MRLLKGIAWAGEASAMALHMRAGIHVLVQVLPFFRRRRVDACVVGLGIGHSAWALGDFFPRTSVHLTL